MNQQTNNGNELLIKKLLIRISNLELEVAQQSIELDQKDQQIREITQTNQSLSAELEAKNNKEGA